MSKHEYHFHELSLNQAWKELKRLEDIEIVHAGLTGSRGCGIGGPDSDHDIRFIYVRPLTHYVYARHREQAVRGHIGKDYDLQGLDLNRALKLVVESNQTAFEMLYGPQMPSSEFAQGAFLDQLHHIFEICYRPEVFTLTAMKSANSYFDGEFSRSEETPEAKVKRLMHSIRLSSQALYATTTGKVPPAIVSDLMEWLGDVDFEISMSAWKMDPRLSLKYLKLWSRIRERYQDVENHRIQAPRQHHYGEVTKLVESIFSKCFK